MRSAIILYLLFALYLPVTAQISNRITVTTDTVEFVMGTGFTSEEAYNRVLARAKRLAVDMAAETYIQSYTRVENYILIQDIVEAVHIGTVVDYQITWRNDDPEESGVQRIVMRAVVECPSIDELRRAVEEKAPEELGVKKGDLFIDSYPEGAAIYIDGDKQAASTPHTFREIPAGKHDITLRKENYRPKTVSVRISPEDPKMINEILERPKGRLKITCNVKGARVWLDNEELGKATVITDELLVGVHDLTVVGPVEYEDYTAEVDVVGNQVNIINIIMRKKSGRILVFVHPSGATIRIEGTGLSVKVKDSHTFQNLEPRAYIITATKPGYSFTEKKVKVPPGTTVSVELYGSKSHIAENGLLPIKEKKAKRKREIFVNSSNLNLTIYHVDITNLNETRENEAGKTEYKYFNDVTYKERFSLFQYEIGMLYTKPTIYGTKDKTTGAIIQDTTNLTTGFSYTLNKTNVMQINEINLIFRTQQFSFFDIPSRVVIKLGGYWGKTEYMNYKVGGITFNPMYEIPFRLTDHLTVYGSVSLKTYGDTFFRHMYYQDKDTENWVGESDLSDRTLVKGGVTWGFGIYLNL